MNTQPEALRLADELARCWADPGLQLKSAAELRRLHALNAELIGVLKAFSDYVRDEQHSTDGAVTYSTTTINHWAFLARDAVAKAAKEAA